MEHTTQYTLISWVGLVFWEGLSLAAGLIGSRFPPGDWYFLLMKPSITPPAWIFAPVWLVLYLLMGFAAWLVWQKAGLRGAGLALGLFVGQLALNAAWSYLFFGQHCIGLALVDLVILWLAIVATLVAFWVHRPLAGVLMAPYLVWVSFAALLNFQFWRLNG